MQNIKKIPFLFLITLIGLLSCSTTEESSSIPYSFSIGIDPVRHKGTKIVEYGYYPQNHVSDETLIEALNKASNENNNSEEVFYNGFYYTKVLATLWSKEGTFFDDGTRIEEGKEYWFKNETIKWRLLFSPTGKHLLLSEFAIERKRYNETYEEYRNGITANNYRHSEIREWLNNVFYKKAFGRSKDYIVQSYIDNSASTTSSEYNYYAENVGTNDNVFLLSYEDYTTKFYGFDENQGSWNFSTKTRQCVATEYTRVKRAIVYEDNCCNYWTRSPNPVFYQSFRVDCVSQYGSFTDYGAGSDLVAVRPAIYVNNLFINN